ncbi:hypothetical protein POVWA2_007780 [Plasmodium ovale wallikeri]|uniref:Uncharacterized protein n=1 Tax=Plasmodium ovale wallikeri TaxID=864142 RepID=A0A1A8YJ15_PLAOA|nr:hypothetical protein POVWA1_007610 [Plasmodium ovale wallikeri]SBT32099.1 hypothetical protein POVWA2_007780 [Plasmodium ovale wallikeri]
MNSTFEFFERIFGAVPSVIFSNCLVDTIFFSPLLFSPSYQHRGTISTASLPGKCMLFLERQKRRGKCKTEAEHEAYTKRALGEHGDNRNLERIPPK